TVQGMILGTAAYMAPEQAKGMAVDKRADIWAFGVVLYEMLVGGSLFAGDSVGDTLAAVLRADIDLGKLPPETPAAIRSLLRRCLERNPKNRLHDIADARIVLEEVVAGKHDEPGWSGVAASASASAGAGAGRWRLAAAAGVVAGLLLGLAGTALWLARGAGERAAPALTQFEVRAPEKTGLVSGLAISPDGRKIAFVGRGEDGRTALWVRSLDTLEARKLPDTVDARYPFWAPDSRRLAFFSQRSLKWIDSLGGSPLEIASTPSVQEVRGGAWGADDVLIYAPTFTGPLFSVSGRGGQSQPATRLPDDGSMGTTRFPSFLPDGRRFVFYSSPGSGTEPGSIHLGRLGSLDAKTLGPATSTAVYAPPGYLLYARGDALVAHRFDEEREELVGEPTPLGVPMGGSISVAGQRSLGVAANGTLAYRTDKRSATQIVWVDRAGNLIEAVTDAESSWHYAPRLSPDGRSLLVAQYQARGKLGEAWVHDLERKVANRVTFGEGDTYMAIWTRPDGREILFNSVRPGNSGGIFRIARDRPDQERLWLSGTIYQAPVSATPDGRRILLERSGATGQVELWLRDLDGEGDEVRLTAEGTGEFTGDISPDGTWVAFASDVTRNWEIYIRRLDGAGGAIRISSGGGSQPLWRRDGRELYYLDTLGRLVAVPIAAGDPLRPGPPETLFAARLEESADRQYDVAADGQRFLLNRSLTSDTAPLVVVLDWTALLERGAR
ncbi:MAG TPA: protein kinase, partial [Thermoanaerobaculia bacterium]|nr:protein kinase [Thermoanaerobaculia bacterium]